MTTANLEDSATRGYLEDVARGAIEMRVDFGDTDSADSIYDQAFVAAHDALMDAGCDNITASTIASQIAQDMAQP